MAVFSTNQNRQLYVVKKANATPAVAGDYALDSVDNKLFIKYMGEGGAMRSDLIDLNSIVYAKHTLASAMEVPLKTATIKLSSAVLEGDEDSKTVISGQDYIIRIYIHNYLAPGDAHTTIKYGAVHSTAGMKPEVFYEKLAKSLTQNFSREAQPLLTFSHSAAGVVINEVEQPWHLGTMSQDSVNFEVVPTTVTIDGEEIFWAELNDEDKIPVVAGSNKVKNGKKIADLEYFCMGERADQYRNMGWPNTIPTKYMVDPSQEYDVLDIHYSFSDTGVNVQKSEKDITFVGSNAVIAALKTSLAGKGVKFN